MKYLFSQQFQKINALSKLFVSKYNPPQAKYMKDKLESD